jgi:hypothetical protein
MGKGQGTRSQALAVTFDPLVVLSDPVPHGVAAVPRGIIPHQQQRGFACGGQLGTDPGQKLDRQGTHGACGYEAQPHVLLAYLLSGPLLHQQTIASQGFGSRIRRGDGLRDEFFTSTLPEPIITFTDTVRPLLRRQLGIALSFVTTLKNLGYASATDSRCASVTVSRVSSI